VRWREKLFHHPEGQGMDLSSIVAGPIDRVLGWFESAFKANSRRMASDRQRVRLLQEFDTAGFRWLTLGRLAGALGLDPEDKSDLETTRKLLVTLPAPGPARKDTTPANRGKPEAEQLWGLASVVDKKG
jgi:hypothetical protein